MGSEVADLGTFAGPASFRGYRQGIDEEGYMERKIELSSWNLINGNREFAQWKQVEVGEPKLEGFWALLLSFNTVMLSISQDTTHKRISRV